MWLIYEWCRKDIVIHMFVTHKLSRPILNIYTCIEFLFVYFVNLLILFNYFDVARTLYVPLHIIYLQ